MDIKILVSLEQFNHANKGRIINFDEKRRSFHIFSIFAKIPHKVDTDLLDLSVKLMRLILFFMLIIFYVLACLSMTIKLKNPKDVFIICQKKSK